MELATEIKIRKTTHSRIREVDFNDLKFGTLVSDHMLICDYSGGDWHQPQILPFANLSLSPATLALHYGQTVFEGMKAYRMHDGRINIFRIERHYERFVKSLERMCMTVVPKEIFIDGLIKLVEVDSAWIPDQEDTALYLRPFEIATEARFGIKVSDEYRFIIFTGPVPLVYEKPIRVKIETHYTRAVKGGTGYTKCGGNYGGAFFPTYLARGQGFDQLLWTDANEHRFIEESGMMNVMFVIDDVLVTPPTSDSILDGITRESLLILAEDLGYKTEVRPIAIDELESSFRNKTIQGAAGIGTAAIVAPISTIHFNDIDFHLPDYDHENLLYKLKHRLNMIRTGKLEDVHNWNFIV
jgi:branched-chain amino acid aminotransferase